jgi:hypothetical protein
MRPIVLSDFARGLFDMAPKPGPQGVDPHGSLESSH